MTANFGGVYTNTPNRKSSPLDSLRENRYKFNSLSYPKEIENLSHYMAFNIFTQKYSKDAETGRSIRVSTPGGREDRSSRGIETAASRQNSSRLNALARKTSLITTSINLYVPETIVYDNTQSYETPSILNEMGIAGSAITLTADKILNYIDGSQFGAVGSTLASTLAVRAATSIPGRSVLPALTRGAQITGVAVNPIIEVLYTSPTLRQFNFEFVFSPSTKIEADEVNKIIYQFRRHSAPELLLGGLLYVPPSEFEITFLKRGSNGFVENEYLPKITTCVLRDVQVDYASVGTFTTFEDGMPIQIRMRLQFQEVNMITRESIDEGY